MTKAVQVTGLKPEQSLGENARKILSVRLAEYYALASTTGDESAVEALHNLRIAAKRLRYTLELFSAAFGETGKRNIERIKQVQEELGVIHDIDVRIELIRDELFRLQAEQLDVVIAQFGKTPKSGHRAILTSAFRPPPDDPRRGLYSLLSKQALDRKHHFQAFIALWNDLEKQDMRRDLISMTWRLDRQRAPVQQRRRNFERYDRLRVHSDARKRATDLIRLSKHSSRFPALLGMRVMFSGMSRWSWRSLGSRSMLGNQTSRSWHPGPIMSDRSKRSKDARTWSASGAEPAAANRSF